MIGDEWPEDNKSLDGKGVHNPVFPKGPFYDYDKYDARRNGYTNISWTIFNNNASNLERLFMDLGSDNEKKRKLANLVMAGGCRPLHFCGMSPGGNNDKLITILLANGADVNALDNYNYTALDRLMSNSVAQDLLLAKGAKRGTKGTKQTLWISDEFAVPW